MALERQTAELLRGYKIFPLPDNPTLRVLRLDTQNEQHWVLVTKEILQMLSEELAKHAEKMAATN